MKPIIDITDECIEILTPFYEMVLNFGTGKPAIEVKDNEITISTPFYEMVLTFNSENSAELKEPFSFVDETGPIPGPSSQGEGNVAVEAAVRADGKPSKAPTKMKACAVCGSMFKPASNAGRYCSEACGMKPPRLEKKKTKRLADMEDDDLDKTLDEIEKRRTQPYAFNK